MTSLTLSLLLVVASKLEISEEPVEAKVPQVAEKDDAAVKEALAVVQKPASNAGLHVAVKVCALLGIDVMKVIAAAKSGAPQSVDERLLVVADGYLGFGDWSSAELAYRAAKPSVPIWEGLGHALRAQNRIAEAGKAYVKAVEGASDSQLEDVVLRMAPIMKEWVSDFEITRGVATHDAAKAVLTAMLPHQAGESSEETKQELARLDAAPRTGKAPALNETRVRAAFAIQLPALRGCYARALVHDPTLKGKMTLSFSFDETGGVVGLQTTSNGTGSKRLAGCVEPRIKALHVATTSSAEVIWPLVFAPL